MRAIMALGRPGCFVRIPVSAWKGADIVRTSRVGQRPKLQCDPPRWRGARGRHYRRRTRSNHRLSIRRELQMRSLLSHARVCDEYSDSPAHALRRIDLETLTDHLTSRSARGWSGLDRSASGQLTKGVSKALKEEGSDITLISAGDFKLEGNPYQPLGKEAKSFMQSRVDDYYGAFTRSVARGRNTTVSAVRDDMGKGRCCGANEALGAGMVDGVMQRTSLGWGRADARQTPVSRRRALHPPAGVL